MPPIDPVIRSGYSVKYFLAPERAMGPRMDWTGLAWVPCVNERCLTQRPAGQTTGGEYITPDGIRRVEIES